MVQELNLYGDSLVTMTGRHGADISSQRLDDLDTEAMLHALRLDDRTGVCLDIGSGVGAQALRLAALGFSTVMVDLIPVDSTVLRVTGLRELLPLSYLMKDVRTLEQADLPNDIALAYSQRFIHYLQFAEALSLLRLVRNRMRGGTKLFLSASGLQSELGHGYEAKSRPLESRFSPLAPPMAEKHGIHEAVCLYEPEDLVALCRAASYVPDRVFSSPFGNVKGIFTAA